MTRLNALQRIRSLFGDGLRKFIPGKSPGGAPAERNPLSRREFVKYGTGLTVALFPLLNCGSAFKDDPGGSGDGNPRISFQVRFDESMDRESVENAVSISPSPPLTGTFTWSENDTVLYYITDVDNETEYTVTIAGTARDTAGNFLDGNGDGSGGDGYSFAVNGVV